MPPKDSFGTKKKHKTLKVLFKTLNPKSETRNPKP
jgi:hypothetical protein